MKRRTITRLPIAVLMMFLVVLTTSAKDDPKDQLEKYRKAVDEMAKTMNSMIKTKRSLASDGRLAPAEDLQITKALLIANEAVTVFHQRVNSMTTLPDASAKAELTTMLNDLSSAIDNLNDQGVLPIANAKSKQKLARFIGKFKAAIAVFSSI